MLGPTMRAELKHAELSEIALPTSARPTISATKDWRAGPSSTLASPTPVASTATCQYSTWPRVHQRAQHERLAAQHRLGHEQQPPLGHAIGDRARHDREEEDRPELERADQAEERRGR